MMWCFARAYCSQGKGVPGYVEAANSIMAEAMEATHSLYPEETWTHITPSLYVAFWSLSLYDLDVPVDAYTTTISKVKDLQVRSLPTPLPCIHTVHTIILPPSLSTRPCAYTASHHSRCNNCSREVRNFRISSSRPVLHLLSSFSPILLFVFCFVLAF